MDVDLSTATFDALHDVKRAAVDLPLALSMMSNYREHDKDLVCYDIITVVDPAPPCRVYVAFVRAVPVFDSSSDAAAAAAAAGSHRTVCLVVLLCHCVLIGVRRWSDTISAACGTRAFL
jgi:hypothetical protein